MSISASVGRGGVNRFADVVHVQGLLNEWALASGGALLVVDGLVGPKTIGAILGYQGGHGCVKDGRVDPAGATLKALQGTDPDQPCRPIARAIVELCDSTLARLPAVGMPLNQQSFVGLRTKLSQTASALRPYVAVGSAAGSARPVFAFAAFPVGPVLPLVQFAPAVAIVQFMLALMAAVIAIMMLQALAPHVGPAASKLAAELEARRQILMSALAEAMVRFIIFVNDIQRALERCRPQGNLNNNPECARALEKAARILKNLLFKLEALKFLWNKGAGGTVPNIADFRNARQLVEELQALATEMQAAVAEVIGRCKCNLLIT
ncbi:hypothetical protein PGB34_07900 [Xenophilus arseniciresistens]|uniref:Peptidoglycan binding-like domain-containing protein n=1 Tax=Xenophilus arseniciresistens TaxID=1283306 RepID=A0AAE3SZ83_9BURK|nr:hypothetical protein [Xenophilus arseniciresistens]MDA7416285.1 hypothetical protein [Xenophilus arseniciresistens]